MTQDPPEKSLSDQFADTGTEMTIQGGGAVIGMYAGAALGGPLGAPIGALAGTFLSNATGPLIARVLGVAGQHAHRRDARGVDAILLAAEQLGISGEELLARLENDPVRFELLAQIFQAAARTPFPDKVRALASALAIGAGRELDRAIALSRAIDAIEGPHVRVLRHIETDGPRQHHEASAPHTGGIGTTADMIRADMPDDGPLVDSVISVLQLHGLIRDIAYGTYGGGTPRFLATDLGGEVLALLKAGAVADERRA
jgi:hypothetical protein